MNLGVGKVIVTRLALSYHSDMKLVQRDPEYNRDEMMIGRREVKSKNLLSHERKRNLWGVKPKRKSRIRVRCEIRKRLTQYEVVEEVTRLLVGFQAKWCFVGSFCFGIERRLSLGPGFRIDAQGRAEESSTTDTSVASTFSRNNESMMSTHADESICIVF
jgi:hypothetical protein